MLSRLVDKSLVQRQVDGRYAMHELLRQFAGERQGDDDLARRHARFFAHWLRGQEKELDHGDQNAIKRVTQEFANLTAAWRWGVNHQDEAVLGLALHGMGSFWELSGRFREADQALEQKLRKMTAISDLLRGRLLVQRGRFNYILGNNPQAKTLLKEALGLLPADAQPAARALALTNLALVRNALGESAAAETHARESLALYTQLDDAAGQAPAHSNLGFVLSTLGRYEEAATSLRRSIALYTDLDNRRGRLKPLSLLGGVCNAQGDYAQAQQLYGEGLAIAKGLHDRWAQASFLVNLCVLAKKQGRYEEAAHRGAQSLALFRELGEQRGTAVALKNLGDVACARAEWEAARQHYKESLAIRRAIDDRFGEALDQYALAAWAAAQRKYALAWRYLRPAYRQAEAIQAVALQLYMLPTVAELLLAADQVPQAVAVVRLVQSHPGAETSVRQRAAQVVASWKELPTEEPLTLEDVAQLVEDHTEEK